MSYTLTFNQVYDSDVSKVGFRAVDLATVYRSKQQIPLSFIVPDLIFEEFMLQNRLSIEITRILGKTNFEDHSSVNAAYLEVKGLFRSAKVPDEFLENLEEAYMALSNDSGDAQELLKDKKSPSVNLIVSVGYELDAQDLDGVILNIRGFENFIDALKSSWLFLFSPKQLEFRKRKGIRDFSAGIIVQRMIDADSSVEAMSKSFIGNFDINLETYKGLPDILRECSKDSYSLAREYLTIEHHDSSLQEYKIVKGDKSGLLVKRNLGKFGSDNKVEDSLVIESARLVKKMAGILNNHFKAFLVIKNKEISFFLVNRLFGDSSVISKPYTSSGSTYEENIPELENTKIQPEQEVNSSSSNNFSKSADKSFFLEIILDLEPQLDSEIVKRYKESFGVYPQDIIKAVEELSNKHGLPEKEHIYKLKNLKSIIESGQEINLDEFMKLTDLLKEFLER